MIFVRLTININNMKTYGHGHSDKDSDSLFLAVKEAHDFFIKRTNIIFIVAINIIII